MLNKVSGVKEIVRIIRSSRLIEMKSYFLCWYFKHSLNHHYKVQGPLAIKFLKELVQSFEKILILSV